MSINRKHVMLLPHSVPLQDSSEPQRFLSLPHPRTRLPALFLPYARDAIEDGLLEVQRVEPDSDKRRTWFVEQEVVSDGSLTLLSPFDPLFLVIALLAALPSHFMQYSELWEAVSQLSFSSPLEEGVRSKPGQEDQDDEDERPFEDDVMRFGQLACVRKRLELVCDKQEHDGATLYRLSAPLVLRALQSKVERLTDPNLGIFGPLESTELGSRKSDAEPAAEGDEGAVATETTDDKETPDDKETSPVATKVFPTVSRGLGREGVGDGQGMSKEIQIETRQKSAIGILLNYLPPTTSHALLSSYSFPALTAHQSTISTSSVLSSTYLPGRSSSSGPAGGGNAAAAAKKKKAATKGSRGVEALKTVSTKGMSKMESFFKKVERPAGKAGEKRKAP